uniref:F-box domain-containing protein n=1 Tax=Parastrongyloides trichosuri TaxID=131310 RepID=A0A0N4ZBT3_PARTI
MHISKNKHNNKVPNRENVNIDEFDWHLMPFELQLYTMKFLSINDLLSLKSANKLTYMMISHNHQKFEKFNITDISISANNKCSLDVIINNNKRLIFENFDSLIEMAKHINVTGIIYTQNLDLSFINHMLGKNISSAIGAVIWDTPHLKASLVVDYLKNLNCQYLHLCNSSILGSGDKIFESLSDSIQEIDITEDTYCELTDECLRLISEKSNKSNPTGDILLRSDGAIFSPNGVTDFIQATNFKQATLRVSLRCISSSKEIFHRHLEDKLEEEIQSYYVDSLNIHAFNLINRPICIFVKKFLYD